MGTHCLGGSGWLVGGHGPGTAFTSVFPFGALLVSRGVGGGFIQQYIENNTGFIYIRQKWVTNAWGSWYSPNRPADLTVNNFLKFDNNLANKKIVLYDLGSDHQFFGFGIQADTFRYQLGSASGSHVFYTGTSPATSAELVRLQGNGLADFAYNGRFKGNITPGPGQA
ncbi:hypothetical protein GO730_05830 [Spirosoma sp. HMF3257]|uniref:hypothetical protein n=1 Tax=Spirosoma telluris TaxID=2183553 RepID=UPI0011B945C2|nr:hypothetical protein [Spirosoma telluris]